MTRYIAFLRGINISGKNKVPMAELKQNFEDLGYIEVRTYLNSGNVIFTSDDNINITTDKIQIMLAKHFEFSIPVYVIAKDDLVNILQNAPEWWGTDSKEIYDNLIMIIPPASFDEVYNSIGEPNEKLEKIKNYNNVVFWSFSRKDYQKTNWWSKTASKDICNELTIRTANTVRKISEM